MKWPEGLMLGTIAVLLFAIVLSGPLVSAIDLTPSSGQQVDGNATVSVDHVPTTSIRLVRGRFDAGSYHVEASPSQVTVESVSGTPRLRYTIDVPKLGYTRTSEYELADRSGRLDLSFEPVDISPRRISGRSYTGTVAIWLQTGDEFVGLYQQRVTIEVER